MGCITGLAISVLGGNYKDQGQKFSMEKDQGQNMEKDQGQKLSMEDVEMRNKFAYLNFSGYEYIKKISTNVSKNMEILRNINSENEKLVSLLKDKIDQLIDTNTLKGAVMIGTGNTCKNPCYLYNTSLIKKCPKCNGTVTEDYENGYTTEKKWDRKKNCEVETKKYNETKICTSFSWNNNIGQEDINFNKLCEYFEKTDNDKKIHYVINVEDKTTKEVKKEEVDVPTKYMMINGQRFDFPYGIGMKEFFIINENELFPKPKISLAMREMGNCIDYGHSICFFYEKSLNKKELGQSLGYYGYAWIHMVYIYTCNSCGHKYHIIKTSPFAFRDKSKDVK